MAMSDVQCPKTQGQTSRSNKAAFVIQSVAKVDRSGEVPGVACGVVLTITRNSGFVGAVTVLNVNTRCEKTTSGSSITFYQKKNVAYTYLVIIPSNGTATIARLGMLPAPYQGTQVVSICTG